MVHLLPVMERDQLRSAGATEPERIVLRQREFFGSGATRDTAFRKEQLRRLKAAVASRETAILEALHADLRKSAFEAYSTEVGLVYREISHALRRVGRWARSRRVPTDLFNLPGRSRVHPEPYGVSLIIAPWNYPFQLLFVPLVGALAAGNTAVVKPSEYAPRTAEVVDRIIGDAFPEQYVAAVQGGAETAKALTQLPVDHIFYTGSRRIGSKVMAAAAERLTPVTLELGGKSPTIVDETANLDLAARRIVFGKSINAGQTCVAPDYLLVHESVHDELLEKMAGAVAEFFGESPQSHPRYSRIVNADHFDRLAGMIDASTVYLGGDMDRDDLYIAPTIMTDVTTEHPVMQDEIFGPILPVLRVSSLDDAVSVIGRHPKPLALYLFTRSRAAERKVLRSVAFGGGAVNTTIMHVASLHLPFGGVGPSGMGRYHGKASFDCFSNEKGVLRQPSFFDHGLAYPNSRAGLGVLKRVLK
ncbi:MAG: aldehyde dehydrogenase [bacterium]